MEQEKYEGLVSDVYAHIGQDRLEGAMSKRSMAARVGELIVIMRAAVRDSNIYLYNGVPHCFTGRIYEPFSWADFENMVYDVLERCGLVSLCGRAKQITKACSCIVMSRELEPDPAIIVFRNCVYDLDSKQTFDFDPRFFAVNQVNYDYNPDMEPTQWRMFLDDVLPDRVVQSVLQQFLGAVFIDRRKVEMSMMMILLGSGSNGKSVVSNVVTGVLGKENITNFGLDDLISNGLETKRNIASINGKRLNYSSEIQAETFNRKSDRFKRLVSGESTAARALNANNFMARDIPLIMSNANRLPALTDRTWAMLKRIIVVPFEIEIPPSRQDKQLSYKLRVEYSGIFNWMMEGRDQFIRNKYTIPLPMRLQKAVAEYRAESSTVLMFMLRKGFDFGPSEGRNKAVFVPAKLLYHEYCRWCITEEVAPEDVSTLTKFGLVLKEAGYKKKPKDGRNCYRIYGDVDWSINFERTIGVKMRAVVSEPPFYDNMGQKWVKTRAGLAAELGIGEGMLTAPMRSKLFEGAFRMDADGRTKVFNVDKCREAFHKFWSDKQAAMRKDSDEPYNSFRSKFNARMAELGLPYRKYSPKFLASGVPEGVTVVPDDWKYEEQVPFENQSPKIQRRRMELNTFSLEDYED